MNQKIVTLDDVTFALPNFIVTTVSTATYTALDADEALDVQYSGPVTITLPDTAKTVNGKVYRVSDAWRKSATLNNITVLDESGNIIIIINGSGDSVDIETNGNDWGIV